MVSSGHGVDVCLRIGEAMGIETGLVELSLLLLLMRMFVLITLEVVFYLLMLACLLWVLGLLIVGLVESGDKVGFDGSVVAVIVDMARRWLRRWWVGR